MGVGLVAQRRAKERVAGRWTLPGTPSCLSPPKTAANMNDEQLQSVYVWVDSIPLSRPKRNIGRDFSDGGEEALGVVLLHPVFTNTLRP